MNAIQRGGSRRGRYRLLCLLVVLLSGCTKSDVYPSRPVLLVCPWAAGGGTDRVSRTIAAHLETEAALGVPVNVINATGGKGVTGHSRALSARPDGYTLGMATLELNMMHWSGLTNLSVDDCLPLMSINEDYAALFVLTDARWKTLKELEDEIRRSPKTLTASGTASGGAWHLALAGWLLAADLKVEDVKWISSTGAGPSLQELLSGGFDFVCCSLPEAETLLASGQVRSLGVMSPERAQGYSNVATFAEQGTDWSLGGWRALVLPKGATQDVHATVLAALEKVVTGQTTVGDKTFPQVMEEARFDNTWRSGEELDRFLRDTDQKFGELLTNEAMQSVNEDPFNPHAYPQAIGLLIGLTILAIAIQSIRGQPSDSIDSKSKVITLRGVLSFALILVAIVSYALLAETVGFFLMSMSILIVLSLWMGVRPGIALTTSVLVSAGIYHLFVHGLRVPLPRGWLGW